jgi:hypothetical protein
VLEAEEERGGIKEGDGSDAKRHEDDFSGIRVWNRCAVRCQQFAEELRARWLR